MLKACDDCIHKDICKLKDMYNHILNVTKQDLEDFDEIKDIFEVQLVCYKKMSKPITGTVTGPFISGYPIQFYKSTNIFTYTED